MRDLQRQPRHRVTTKAQDIHIRVLLLRNRLSSATSHTARVTRDFLAADHIRTLPWPVRMPDINPIEHLWDRLGRVIKRRHVQNVVELQQAFVEERGGHTRY